MINTCHMHAYLVCSAGLKLKLHICVVTKAFKHLIMCDSRLSVFLIDRHFLAVIGISAYGALYGCLLYTSYEVRSALAKCGLTTKHIESQVRVLSGGEQAKVRLCKLINRETKDVYKRQALVG